MTFTGYAVNFIQPLTQRKHCGSSFPQLNLWHGSPLTAMKLHGWCGQKPLSTRTQSGPSGPLVNTHNRPINHSRPTPFYLQSPFSLAATNRITLEHCPTPHSSAP